mgnify:FL=1
MIEAADNQILKAQNLLAEGRVEECLQELSLVLARQPENGRAQALLGHLRLRYFRNYNAAEESFKIAMRQAANYPDLYYDYADLLIMLERYTETVAVLNKGMEVPGIEKDKLYILFGRLNERQEKWDDAIDYYTKALIYTFSDDVFAACNADINRCNLKKRRV